jgi:hypothetical protein
MGLRAAWYFRLPCLVLPCFFFSRQARFPLPAVARRPSCSRPDPGALCLATSTGLYFWLMPASICTTLCVLPPPGLPSSSEVFPRFMARSGQYQISYWRCITFQKWSQKLQVKWVNEGLPSCGLRSYRPSTHTRMRRSASGLRGSIYRWSWDRVYIRFSNRHGV